MVSILTFTQLSEPTIRARITSGDLHLVCEGTEMGFGWSTACKTAKSHFIAFCSFCSICDISCFLHVHCPITFPSTVFFPLLGFREGRLRTKPAAPVLLSSLTQGSLSHSFAPPFISACNVHPDTCPLQGFGCPGPCLSKLGCTLFLRGGGLRFLLRVGMVVV